MGLAISRRSMRVSSRASTVDPLPYLHRPIALVKSIQSVFKGRISFSSNAFAESALLSTLMNSTSRGQFAQRRWAKGRGGGGGGGQGGGRYRREASISRCPPHLLDEEPDDRPSFSFDSVNNAAQPAVRLLSGLCDSSLRVVVHQSVHRDGETRRLGGG